MPIYTPTKIATVKKPTLTHSHTYKCRAVTEIARANGYSHGVTSIWQHVIRTFFKLIFFFGSTFFPSLSVVIPITSCLVCCSMCLMPVLRIKSDEPCKWERDGNYTLTVVDKSSKYVGLFASYFDSANENIHQKCSAWTPLVSSVHGYKKIINTRTFTEKMFWCHWNGRTNLISFVFLHSFLSAHLLLNILPAFLCSTKIRNNFWHKAKVFLCLWNHWYAHGSRPWSKPVTSHSVKVFYKFVNIFLFFISIRSLFLSSFASDLVVCLRMITILIKLHKFPKVIKN